MTADPGAHDAARRRLAEAGRDVARWYLGLASAPGAPWWYGMRAARALKVVDEIEASDDPTLRREAPRWGATWKAAMEFAPYAGTA